MSLGYDRVRVSYTHIGLHTHTHSLSLSLSLSLSHTHTQSRGGGSVSGNSPENMYDSTLPFWLVCLIMFRRKISQSHCIDGRVTLTRCSLQLSRFNLNYTLLQIKCLLGFTNIQSKITLTNIYKFVNYKMRLCQKTWNIINWKSRN